MAEEGVEPRPIGRPRSEPKNRTATAIRLRPELHAGLAKAAEEREVSINWLINRAVADFLPRLLPVDEIRWTRDG